MKYLGWTVNQTACAKQRYNLHLLCDLPKDADGLMRLHRWWVERSWPEPLSVRIEGVEPELDVEWASEAIRNAVVASLSRPVLGVFYHEP